MNVNVLDDRLLSALLMLVLLAVTACGSRAVAAVPALPPITLGVEDSWPPYSNSYGEGLSKRIVVAAFNAMDQTVSFVVHPYARVLRDVESGILDGGFNVTRQKSTQERFIFGEEPLLQARASFYYPSNNQFALGPQEGIADGARVGLIIDYEYGDTYDARRHKYHEVRVGQQSQIVRMLVAGRLDVAIMFDRVARSTMETMGMAQDSIKRGALNHSSDIYLVFSKKNPLAEDYARQFDRGLKIIKASGEYADILQ